MKSLQDYINTYRSIASKLNIKGDSSELLIQLLANASYISEVENIAYTQEASFERASLMNSKIQHCIDNMYSVFRGTCPRMVLKIKPNKMFTFNTFDEIMVSNSFKVYYLGYYNGKDTDEIKGEYSYMNGFDLNSITLSPSSGEKIILCFLAKETVDKEWLLNESNTLFVNCLEDNLSNDVLLTVNNSSRKSVTTDFNKHLIDGTVFDLTIPGFGSRLYGKDWAPSTEIKTKYFKYTELSEYNESELKRLSIKGAELVQFNSDFLEAKYLKELIPGMCLVEGSKRESLKTIHYKASESRYTNTLIKSNSDLGALLEKITPEKVSETISTSSGNKVIIYYIPIGGGLSQADIDDFIDNYKSYYITDIIEVNKGSEYNVNFNISLELYKPDETINSSIEGILEEYDSKFNINFLKDSQTTNSYLINNSVYNEIEARILKLDNVKRVRFISPNYSVSNINFNESDSLWSNMINNLIKGSVYYKVSSSISSMILQ